MNRSTCWEQVLTHLKSGYSLKTSNLEKKTMLLNSFCQDFFAYKTNGSMVVLQKKNNYMISEETVAGIDLYFHPCIANNHYFCQVVEKVKTSCKTIHQKKCQFGHREWTSLTHTIAATFYINIYKHVSHELMKQIEFFSLNSRVFLQLRAAYNQIIRYNPSDFKKE
ncbi:hypothetical protein ACJX0J_029200 [Zea mays]